MSDLTHISQESFNLFVAKYFPVIQTSPQSLGVGYNEYQFIPY